MSDHPTSPNSVGVITDNFFRHESGKLASSLVRVFGTENIQLAEDVVQEALVKAIRTWPYSGIPDNPSAWITLVAKNLALDIVRRNELARRKEALIFGSTYKWSSSVIQEDVESIGTAIDDDILRMLLVCCHPDISEDTQPLLALKMVCAFSAAEIASAFLSSESAILKRLTRAKERLRESPVPMELMLGDELTSRTDGVLRTLYLLFNEGYKGSSGEQLTRSDLCEEAIRLATILLSNESFSLPRAHALLALMLFNYSRLPSRSTLEGSLIQLADQDRTLWNPIAISQGMVHLEKSHRGDVISTYHIQAMIAAVHCNAATFADTDWSRIESLYDLLMQIEPSPTAALSRAVAISHTKGPAFALQAIEEIPNRNVLTNYYLYYAVKADFQIGIRLYDDAVANLRLGLDLANNVAERSFIQQRLDNLEKHS